MRDGGKALYEALQAVNAKLDEEGEQLLIDLVEKIRHHVRRHNRPEGARELDVTLRRWIDFDAAERAEPLVCVGCHTGRGSHSIVPGVCRTDEAKVGPWSTPPALRHQGYAGYRS